MVTGAASPTLSKENGAFSSGNNGWDAFGSSSSEDEDDGVYKERCISSSQSPSPKKVVPQAQPSQHRPLAECVALHLVRRFLSSEGTADGKTSSSTVSVDFSPSHLALPPPPPLPGWGDPLSSRVVAVCTPSDEGAAAALRSAISSRGATVCDMNSCFKDRVDGSMVDAAVVVPPSEDDDGIRQLWSSIRRRVVPGGIFLWISISSGEIKLEDPIELRFLRDAEDAFHWDTSRVETTKATSSITIHALRRHSTLPNIRSCLWRSQTSSVLSYERAFLNSISIVPSASSFTEAGRPARRRLSPHEVKRSISLLSLHGLVIFRSLYDPADVRAWGRAGKEDLSRALSAIARDTGDDVSVPGGPVLSRSYREMAAREPLRFDLRSGPSLSRVRRSPRDAAVRLRPDLLEIVAKTFDPPGPHPQGNYGRWNFGGRHPGSGPRAVRVGEVGVVATLPGASDQAVHADAAHLYENVHLPPCYLNLFLPAFVEQDEQDDHGDDATESVVGGTAFVVGTHQTETCERVMASPPSSLSEGSSRAEYEMRTLRPHLRPGDAILMDTRLLHFGLGNGGRRGIDVRPLLYINITTTWFVDPKNWGGQKDVLFPEIEELVTGGGTVW